MRPRAGNTCIFLLSLLSLAAVVEAVPQRNLYRRQVLGGAGVLGGDSATTDSGNNAGGNNGGNAVSTGAGAGGGAATQQPTTKAQVTASTDGSNPTTRNDPATSAQQPTTQQSVATPTAQPVTTQQPSTTSAAQILTPTVVSSTSRSTSSSSSSSKASSSSISSITRLSSILLPSSSFSIPSSSLSSSALPSASAAPDTSDSSSTSGPAKKTIIIIIVVASVLGLAFGAWTIIRKTKLGPSARFEEKLQPIDWSPRTGENDAVYLKEMSAEGDSNSMHDAGAQHQEGEYYPYLGRSPSGRTLPEHDSGLPGETEEQRSRDLSNIGDHTRTMSNHSGNGGVMRSMTLHDTSGLSYDNGLAHGSVEPAMYSGQYEPYPTMNPSEYGGVGTFQSHAGQYATSYAQPHEVGTMSHGSIGPQFGYSNYYEVPYAGPTSNGGGSMYGRGPRSYQSYDDERRGQGAGNVI